MAINRDVLAESDENESEPNLTDEGNEPLERAAQASLRALRAVARAAWHAPLCLGY